MTSITCRTDTSYFQMTWLEISFRDITKTMCTSKIVIFDVVIDQVLRIEFFIAGYANNHRQELGWHRDPDGNNKNIFVIVYHRYYFVSFEHFSRITVCDVPNFQFPLSKSTWFSNFQLFLNICYREGEEIIFLLSRSQGALLQSELSVNIGINQHDSKTIWILDNVYYHQIRFIRSQVKINTKLQR